MKCHYCPCHFLLPLSPCSLRVLPASKTEVAIKIVSHDATQGMKHFVREVVSIGCLRHRNVVQLLGYCRRKGELHLVVYDCMPNGSLDRWLYDHGTPPLS